MAKQQSDSGPDQVIVERGALNGFPLLEPLFQFSGSTDKPIVPAEARVEWSSGLYVATLLLHSEYRQCSVGCTRLEDVWRTIEAALGGNTAVWRPYNTKRQPITIAKWARKG